MSSEDVEKIIQLYGDGKIIQKDVYSLQELSDTLTFMVNNCMTKEAIAKVKVVRN